MVNAQHLRQVVRCRQHNETPNSFGQQGWRKHKDCNPHHRTLKVFSCNNHSLTTIPLYYRPKTRHLIVLSNVVKEAKRVQISYCSSQASDINSLPNLQECSSAKIELHLLEHLWFKAGQNIGGKDKQSGHCKIHKPSPAETVLYRQLTSNLCFSVHNTFSKLPLLKY